MPTIIYIVHKTTIDNENKIVSGHFDCDLSDKGLIQAKNMFLQMNSFGLKYGTVFSSDLKRAVTTSKILFPQLEIVLDERLREIDYGLSTHFKKELIDAQRNRKINEPFEEGESYLDVEKRIKSFLQDHKNLDVMTIVSHQAPQLALEVLCKNVSWEKAFLDDWRLKENGWQPYWIYNFK